MQECPLYRRRLRGVILTRSNRPSGGQFLALITTDRIERSILFIGEHKVLLDSDLAAIYGVTTALLNQQVRRNIDRFPEDFAFVLTTAEFADLKLQFATSSSGWGGRRTPPFVFTEHGAVMAASVLNTPIAVAASIEVVRTFLLTPISPSEM